MKKFLILVLVALLGCTATESGDTYDTDTSTADESSGERAAVDRPDDSAIFAAIHGRKPGLPPRGTGPSAPPVTQRQAECWWMGRDRGCEDVGERFDAPPQPHSLVGAQDQACGSQSYRLQTIDGWFLTPESARWNPFIFTGVGFGVFTVTSTAFPTAGPASPDGFGWMNDVEPFSGTASGGPDWNGNWGAGQLDNPLGLSIGLLNGSTYVVEGAKKGSPPAPSIVVYDVGGFLVQTIRMPGVLTINDVAWVPPGILDVGPTLLVTDSQFATPGGGGSLWLITNPDIAGASVVSKWLDLGSAFAAPNPIVFRFVKGLRPVVYIATLGTVLSFEGEHNGVVIEVDLQTKVAKNIAPGLFGFFDGLDMYRDLVDLPWASDLGTRKVFEIDTVGNPGAFHEELDLSKQMQQLGGFGCVPGAPKRPCVMANFQDTALAYIP